MFNAQKPSLAELPSSAQLLRSTVIAAISAVAILVTVILPAEYGIDPTGVGRVLGLTEMGEIKRELSEEAERDHGADTSIGDQSTLFAGFLDLLVGKAHAQAATGAWTEEVAFTLAPGETYEVKLTMNEDDVAEYRMIVEGARVNFELHAHGAGQSITYERGRGSAGAEGKIIAAFTGDHGWFWRNRDNQSLTVTLQVRGTYSELKKAN
jgi:hypothetical protein